ncbi:MAG: NFACT RNA binding domain-containing protein [Candidatus Woesearchaeota archaeon]
MVEIKLDLRKSVEENAGLHFEKAKKLKKKLVGAKATVERVRKELDRFEKKELAAVELPKVDRRKQWFEKFRWFLSSEGFLVVGGRDATTNEIIIKKHTEPEDLVFHTDMSGSPFFVVKADGKQPGVQTLREAADATFSFSRSSKTGMTTSPVFYVTPAQVSRTPNPGESLPKGAFIIRGKTNYIENKFNVAVGIYKGAVMAGPLEAVQKHCEKYLQLIPGEKKPSDIAKMVRKLIGGELDEIIRALPSGNCDLKKP